MAGALTKIYIRACPRCEHPIVMGHVEGIPVRLSTRAVPMRDAWVLHQYGHVVYVLWIEHDRLNGRLWCQTKTLAKGRHLFVDHVCGSHR